jgi:hypothetical protein
MLSLWWDGAQRKASPTGSSPIAGAHGMNPRPLSYYRLGTVGATLLPTSRRVQQCGLGSAVTSHSPRPFTLQSSHAAVGAVCRRWGEAGYGRIRLGTNEAGFEESVSFPKASFPVLCRSPSAAQQLHHPNSVRAGPCQEVAARPCIRTCLCSIMSQPRALSGGGSGTMR